MLEPQLILNGIGAEAFFASIKAIVREELNCLRDYPHPPNIAYLEGQPATLREACTFLNVSLSTLRKLKREGKINFFKLGGRVYIKRAHLLALRDGEQITPAA